MATRSDQMPEGTDSIINGASETGGFEGGTGLGGVASGASVGPGSTSSTTDSAKSAASAAKEQIQDKASGLRDQASDKAREYALLGKDRAVGAIDNVTKLIDDAADAIEEKVGPNYGAYVRRASETLAGVSTTLQDKDVDELLDDAREVIRKSPALAIGAATALGFVIARIVKAGAPDPAPTPATSETPSTSSTPATDTGVGQSYSGEPLPPVS